MKYIASSLLLCSATLSAQVGYETGFDLPYYVNEVLLSGQGEASNITYAGGLSQIGVFTDVMGLSNGLVMSTDQMVNAFCENQTCLDCVGSSLSDADLLEVANSVPPLIGENFTVSSVNDVAILEFDFVAMSNYLSIEFLFGSDEYPTYVYTQYNDVFAIFLSGLDIAGPYSSSAAFPDGAVNLAIVPGSSPPLPVTISSVNTQMNSEWYFDDPNLPGICLNGMTLPMLAEHPLTVGETYHLKFAIADGSDTALESVFMCQAGIFSESEEQLVDIEIGSDVGGGWNSEIFESCGTLALTLTRSGLVSLSEPISMALDFATSQATNGVDFGIYDASGVLQPVPSAVVLEPFQEAITLEISAPFDGETEGTEFGLLAINVETNSLEEAYSVDFSISDAPDPIAVVAGNYSACPGEPITLEPQVTGGYGQYNFQWCSGETTSTLTASWSEDSSCELMIDDTCGTAAISVLVEVDVFEAESVQVELSTNSPEELGCNDVVELSATPSGGQEPYTFDWGAYNLDLISDDAWAVVYNPTGPSYVAVSAIDGCGHVSLPDTLHFAYWNAPFDVILPDTIWGHCGMEMLLEAYPPDAPEEMGGFWLQNGYITAVGASMVFDFSNQSDLVFEGFDGCGGQITHTIHVAFDGDICGEFDCEDGTTALVNGEDSPWMIACPGEPVALSGAASFSNTTDGIISYSWNVDGTYSNEPEIELELGSGLHQVTLIALSTHSTSGVTCQYTDIAVAHIAVSSEPTFNPTFPEVLCAGESFSLIAGADFPPILENPPAISTGTWILPDDQSQCHEFPLWVSTGSPGMTVDADMTQEMTVTVVMEHSFMGDLTIELACPDGNILPLHEMGGNGTYLGEPVDMESSPYDPGIGYEYSWSPNATNSTWAAESFNVGTLPPGTYAATGDWADLEGCSVNGEWTLTFCDSWGADNGFLFGWGIQFTDDQEFGFDDIQNPAPDWDCAVSGWAGNPAAENCQEWAFPEGISTDTSFVYTLQSNYGCTFTDTVAVSLSTPGCMDPEAANYNAQAECPADCFYELSSCEALAAQDWSLALTGVYPEYRSGHVGVDSVWNWMVHLSANEVSVNDMTDFALADFEVTGLPPGLGLASSLIFLSAGDQTCLTLTGTPTTAGLYTLTITGELYIESDDVIIPAGIQTYTTDLEILENPAVMSGCTYSTAANFSPEATQDDGSCIFPGCMDPLATNYSTVFNAEDDGTCVYEEAECLGDLTGDGEVNVGDLLAFLAVFGTECPSGPGPNNAWTCGDPLLYQGHNYATVAMGDACWFAENLRSTAYSNGDEIPEVEDGAIADWAALPFGTRTIYGEVNCPGNCNVAENLETYGRLYSRRAIQDGRNVCPAGWHVPDVDDWYSLQELITPGICVGCANEEFSTAVRSELIWDCAIPGTNSAGLNVVPGGTFGSWTEGYNGEGTLAIFGVYYDETIGNPWGYSPFWVACNWGGLEGIGSNNAYSVRCIQD